MFNFGHPKITYQIILITHSMETIYTISGQIVDLKTRTIFSGSITIENGKIKQIKKEAKAPKQFILPGLVDSHVHIESSMLTPSEFARLAVVHGTVATVSDPHEIANVLGMEGVKYMIENGKKVPFKFLFGAPSCVPSTSFETSGAVLDSTKLESLMAMKEIGYLGEMMNYPGVLFDDPEVLKKIELSKKYGKPIDGHAPGVVGKDLEKYIHAGISTDHESATLEEAEKKIEGGMKILIREGSAAKNFDALVGLLKNHADMVMFCSDDKHPDNLVNSHINELVKRAIALGYDKFDVLRCASLNAVEHYNLNVGLLQVGDPADMIVVDNLNDFNVLKTFIDGKLVAENGKTNIQTIESKLVNVFVADKVSPADFFVKDEGKKIRIIGVTDGQLTTDAIVALPKVENGNMVSDLDRDILKITVINRYKKSKPIVGFIKNVGLKKGAFASSVAHDSHNIIAVGTSDENLAAAVNLLIESKGGVIAYSPDEQLALPLPVAGLMSPFDGYQIAKDYEEIDRMVKSFGSTLYAPFMTMAFMALLVIPQLKIGDKGLFDVNSFSFVSLCV